MCVVGWLVSLTSVQPLLKALQRSQVANCVSYHLDSTLLSPKDQESWSELGMMQGKVFERKKYGRDCGLCRWEEESIKER